MRDAVTRSPAADPGALDVALLKNLRFGDPTAGPLPYRADHLMRHGIALHTTDRPWRAPFTRPPLARVPEHLVQVAALAPRILTCPVTLAMFESSAHPLGLARDLVPPLRRAPLAVISCWLPEVLAAAGPARLRWYRRAYRHVDRLFYFSHNQRDLLADLLDLDDDRLAHLTFGVDVDELASTVPGGAEVGPILAPGRDRGRDWPTLFAAVDRAGVDCTVFCRPSELGEARVPDGVVVMGMVDRATYRRQLASSRAVVVATHVLGYPTGQTVLLEAMAAGKACIVTDTPALREYVEPGVTALTVPPHDPDALAEVLRAVDRGEVDTTRLGERARRAARERFDARGMWDDVARHLFELAGRPLPASLTRPGRPT